MPKAKKTKSGLFVSPYLTLRKLKQLAKTLKIPDDALLRLGHGIASNASYNREYNQISIW